MKGSFVLMICQKNTYHFKRSREVGPIFTARVGNWMLAPRENAGGFHGCAKDLCLCPLCRDTCRSTTCLWLWPGDLSLWALLDSALEAVFWGQMPHLALSGKLEFFCSLKEKKNCDAPLEGRLLMKFQAPHCSNLVILYSVNGLGFLGTRASLRRGNLFHSQHHRLQFQKT